MEAEKSAGRSQCRRGELNARVAESGNSRARCRPLALFLSVLYTPILCMTLAGCATQSGPPSTPSAAASGVMKPRIGKVTKEMILLDGGACDGNDLCFDRLSRQNFDCDVEFYCVPTASQRPGE